MSDFSLKGLEGVLEKLEDRLGSKRMKIVSGKALRVIATEHVALDLVDKAETFRDEGNTVNQVSVGNVSWADYNVPRIKVGWARSPKGESPRWNIEHLNEFGYNRHGKFIRPRGYGKMQELITEYEDKFPELLREALQELFT